MAGSEKMSYAEWNLRFFLHFELRFCYEAIFILKARSSEPAATERIMDWIEHVFHVSPDGGHGSLELLFFLFPAAAFLIGPLSLLWFWQVAKRRRNKRDNTMTPT